jgi:cysteine synthase A
MAIHSSILEHIGNTPLIRLGRLARHVAPEVLVKAEHLNPSGSIKDRVALRMIEDAEAQGILKPGMEVIESSTGNTGTALAFVGGVKGYRVTIYVPRSVFSEERQKILSCYGAQILPVDIEDLIADKDVLQAVHGARVEILPRRVCAQKEAASKNVWWARQFSNPSNAYAHRDTTGKEILKDAGGKIDVFLAAVGTGGTLLGVSEALLAANPSTKIIAVEPKGHRSIVDGKLAIPVIEGFSGGLLVDLVDRKIISDVIAVDENDAIRMAHSLSEEEGLFCGLTSGANVFAALQVARDMDAGQRIVTVLPDNRDRYLFSERLTT